MDKYMTIGFASNQTRKEDGHAFVSIKGSTVHMGQLIDAEITIDSESAGYPAFKLLADKFDAEYAAKTENYPRGFSVFFPNGLVIAENQDRTFKDKLTGAEKLGAWGVTPLRGELASIKLGKTPPLKIEIDPEVAEMLKSLGT
jgi:hypothetical protein